MSELGKLKDVDNSLGQLLLEMQSLNSRSGGDSSAAAVNSSSVVPGHEENISDYLVIDRSHRDYDQRLVVKTGILPKQQPVIFLHGDE